MAPLVFWLASSAVLVAASVGLVVGVRRLAYWTRLDGSYLGEVVVTFAWVIPEYLIAVKALMVPGRSPYHWGEPLVAVGVVLGSAAANMLVLGIVGSGWPRMAGLEVVQGGRSLASAAVVLLVCCASIVGLGVGRGVGMSPAQLISGLVVFAVFLGCLRIVARPDSKDKATGLDLELPTEPGRGSLIGALAVAVASVLALVYLTPYWVDLAVPRFRSGDDLPHMLRALMLGGLAIGLGLMMAVPDLILTLLDLRSRSTDTATTRLFLSSTALIAFTAIAGMDGETLFNALATSLFASCFLTVFIVALTVILLLAIPGRTSPRARGRIVLGLALAGLALSLVAPTF